MQKRFSRFCSKANSFVNGNGPLKLVLRTVYLRLCQLYYIIATYDDFFVKCDNVNKAHIIALRVVNKMRYMSMSVTHRQGVLMILMWDVFIKHLKIRLTEQSNLSAYVFVVLDCITDIIVRNNLMLVYNSL